MITKGMGCRPAASVKIERHNAEHPTRHEVLNALQVEPYSQETQATTEYYACPGEERLEYQNIIISQSYYFFFFVFIVYT